jgi:hypothetical protein
MSKINASHKKFFSSVAALSGLMVCLAVSQLVASTAVAEGFCEGRLNRSVAAKGSCEYKTEDGVYTVCLNFIGAGIPDDILKLACMGAPKGIQTSACPMTGVTQICAKDPVGQYWAERVMYAPYPAGNPDEDCKDENGIKAILCQYP